MLIESALCFTAHSQARKDVREFGDFLESIDVAQKASTNCKVVEDFNKRE